jgi:hypothetical protein
MALVNFNANNVDPQQAFEPIPAGWYNGMIVESESKGNAAGTGSYISLKVKIIDGQFANRQIFDLLNIDHPNLVTKEIAEKKLSGYCHATNVMQLQDTQQLHGIPFSFKVGIKVDKTGQYDPQNDIRAVKALGQIPQATVPPVGFGAPPAGFAPQQPPAGFARPPQPAPAVAPQYVPPAPQYQAPAPQQAPVAQAQAPQAPVAGATPPWAKRKPV